MHSSHLIEQTAGVLTAAFAAGLWQSIALVLLAGALLRLMPRASARVRHALLLASYAAALLLPFLQVAFARSRTSAESHAVAVGWYAALAVALLWITAALGRAVQLFVAWRHLRSVRRDAVPVAIEGMEAFPAGGRHARLCASSAVDSPTVLGFWRPVLLLPEWMVPRLSAEELRQIAVHECEHLRRHDDWLNLLLQLGLVLSPLNPGLVWLNRRIGVQRELACDDAVIAATGQPIAYASCLARLAEQRMQRRRHLRLALAAWERKSELALRVHALLQGTSRWTARQSAAASAGAAVVLLGASAGLARSPQLVRIVQPATAAATEAAVQVVAPTRIALAPVVSAPAIHLTPVVFPLTNAARTNSNHRTHPAKRKALQQTVDNRPVDVTTQPFTLRTSAETDADLINAVQQDDSTPVRFVTAEFPTPYVAVPTPGGWLLIEL